MRITTIAEFRDRTSRVLRSRTPILVTQRGRLVGIFFPLPEIALPIALKRGIHDALSRDIVRKLKLREVSEDEVLGDFLSFRKKRLAARRRHERSHAGRRAPSRQRAL